jgi:phage terminase small subunit
VKRLLTSGRLACVDIMKLYSYCLNLAHYASVIHFKANGTAQVNFDGKVRSTNSVVDAYIMH